MAATDQLTITVQAKGGSVSAGFEDGFKDLEMFGRPITAKRVEPRSDSTVTAAVILGVDLRGLGDFLSDMGDNPDDATFKKLQSGLKDFFEKNRNLCGFGLLSRGEEDDSPLEVRVYPKGLKDDNIKDFFNALSGDVLSLIRNLEYPVPGVLLLQLEYDLISNRFSQVTCWDKETGAGHVYTTESKQWFRATK